MWSEALFCHFEYTVQCVWLVREVLLCGFDCIHIVRLLALLRSKEPDSASWSVASCGMAQSKYLPTSRFSVYEVEMWKWFFFSWKTRVLAGFLGQDLEWEVVCVPASGRAKGVVPWLCLELNRWCLPLAATLAMKVEVTLLSGWETGKSFHVCSCSGERRSG